MDNSTDIPLTENTSNLVHSDSPQFKEYAVTILKELLSYTVGLISLVLAVSVFGYFLGGAMVSRSGEYFGLLGDSINLMFVMPLLLIVFGVIAAARRDWIFLLYPLVVFFIVGPSIYESSSSQALGLLFPFQIEGLRSSNLFLATIMFSYASLYTVERPLSRLVSRGRFRPKKDITGPHLVSVLAILLIGLVASIAISVAAPAIITQKKKEAVSVRMPQTADFISSKQYAKNNKFTIHYMESTQQYGGVYNMRDEVTYTKLKQGAPRDTKSVCVKSNTSLKTDYLKTKNNVEYTNQIIPLHSSNLAQKTNAYNEYQYCFVLDGTKYVLTRSDLSGSEYLTKYPADIIIAAFADTKNSPDMNTKPLPEQNIPQSNSNNINPHAYSPVGYLEVKEWGIKIPLTETTAGSYYAPATVGQVLIKGSLRESTQRGCSADDTGMFYIARIPKTELELQKNASTQFIAPNKIVGDYAYAVYANGNAKNCLDTQQKIDTFEDTLKWATTNTESL